MVKISSASTEKKKKTEFYNSQPVHERLASIKPSQIFPKIFPWTEGNIIQLQCAKRPM